MKRRQIRIPKKCRRVPGYKSPKIKMVGVRRLELPTNSPPEHTSDRQNTASALHLVKDRGESIPVSEHISASNEHRVDIEKHKKCAQYVHGSDSNHQIQELIKSWADLPPEIRQSIISIIRAVKTQP